MDGWYTINRKLLSSSLWLGEKFTKGQAWVDLLGLARHDDGFIRVRGIKVPIKRGQVGWSEVKLAERWQWSRGKTKRFINELKTVQQIEQQTSYTTSVITIINYDLYQPHSTADDTASDTAKGQQTDSKRYTNNNDKKGKKEKKERRKQVALTIPTSFKRLYDPKFLNILQREYPSLDVESKLDDLMDWLAKTGAHPKRKKPLDWVREKFDQEKDREGVEYGPIEKPQSRYKVYRKKQ